MSERVMQALCCECGALRTCRRPRNYRRENFWLSEPVDRDWHRETGDLKCGNCGKITRHAIILPEGYRWRDHVEDIHKMAIGWEFKNMTPEVHRRVRERWREGLPRNPYLHHQWWISDETAARAAGQTHVITMCMTYAPLPKKVSKPGTGVDRDVVVKPHEFRDTEYQDPETGLWWYWMDCPDCLLRSNAIALDEQRGALKDKLLDVAARLSTLDATAVERLLTLFSDSEESA